MRRLLRNGALALTLAASAALVSAPSSAGSIQRDGYLGGSWTPIGPQNNRHVQRFHRSYGYSPGRYAYYGPSSRYYGPRYNYGPSYYGPPGGIGFGIGIY